MILGVNLLLATALGAASLGTVTDDLCLLRIHPTHKKQRLWIDVHQPAPGETALFGALRANDPRFQKLGGGKPVRFAFGAQWDGLEQEEIVVLRERRRDGALELLVYDMPGKLGGDTGAPLVKSAKGELGSMAGDERVVAAGPIDVDGDGRDEILLVREALDGAQSLEVRRIPARTGEPIGPPLVSDDSFGQAVDDEVVGLFGCQIFFDHQEEIVVLRRSASLFRLEVLRLPQAPHGETGAALASDLDVSPPDGATLEGMWRLRTTDAPEFRPLLLARDQAGAQRLELLDLPEAPADDVGAPLAVHSDLTVSGLVIDLFAAFGVENPGAPPWTEFDGAWQLSLRVAYQDGKGNTIQEWVGPFGGFRGDVLTTSSFALDFPPGTTPTGAAIAGTVTGWAPNGLFTPFWVNATHSFFPFQGSGLVVPGDRITITYPSGWIDNPEGAAPTIWGQGSLAFTIGEVVAADGVTLKAVVTEYLFARG